MKPQSLKEQFERLGSTEPIERGTDRGAVAMQEFARLAITKFPAFQSMECPEVKVAWFKAFAALVSACAGSLEATAPQQASNPALQSTEKRFDGINQRFDDMRDLWRAELRRVEEVLDARLKHLEEGR